MKNRIPLPSQDYLLGRLLLNDDGSLIWKKRDVSTFPSPRAEGMWNKRFAGKPAGCRSANGYQSLRIDFATYKSHRVVWTMVHGGIPEGMDIDHINGDRSDNRPANLRLCSRLGNARNNKIYKSNTTGYKGVSRHSSGKGFVATCRNGKEQVYLGFFMDAKEAHEAYRRAASEYHGEFANFG